MNTDAISSAFERERGSRGCSRGVGDNFNVPNKSTTA